MTIESAPSSGHAGGCMPRHATRRHARDDKRLATDRHAPLRYGAVWVRGGTPQRVGGVRTQPEEGEGSVSTARGSCGGHAAPVDLRNRADMHQPLAYADALVLPDLRAVTQGDVERVHVQAGLLVMPETLRTLAPNLHGRQRTRELLGANGGCVASRPRELRPGGPSCAPVARAGSPPPSHPRHANTSTSNPVRRERPSDDCGGGADHRAAGPGRAHRTRTYEPSRTAGPAWAANGTECLREEERSREIEEARLPAKTERDGDR